MGQAGVQGYPLCYPVCDLAIRRPAAGLPDHGKLAPAVFLSPEQNFKPVGEVIGLRRQLVRIDDMQAVAGHCLGMALGLGSQAGELAGVQLRALFRAQVHHAQ